MNKSRRKQLSEITEQIEALKQQLEEIRDQEQDAFDNMPEGIQSAANGQKMEEAVSLIESIIDGLEETIFQAQELIS